jgi:gliding motility-associated-like protein
MRVWYSLFPLCLLYGLQATGQVNPYVLNGSATQNSCNCYTLTPSQANQAGSVWNKNKIDLSQSFDYRFNIFLGCRSSKRGADGIAFVLQPVSTSLGVPGNGLGFAGITPSLGVTIDTYPNTQDSDPSYDHIAFQANGDVNHTDTNNLDGPVQALADSSNIKDCSWHVLEIQWNAAAQVMTAFVDGSQRLSMTKDIVKDVFQNNPLVFWGFTAATGEGYNQQGFCTSLNAHYRVPSDQAYCENQPIHFQDSSTAFGSIIQWSWDFGDGTTSNVSSPPAHRYPHAGTYTLIQVVGGDNGCLSDTNRATILIGTYPVAAFIVENACSGRPLALVNTSSDSVGGIAQWRWTLTSGQTYTDSLPYIVPPASGNYGLHLSALSNLGCLSNDADTAFTVYPTPVVSFAGDTACVDSSLVLTGTNPSGIPLHQWYWSLGGVPDSTQRISLVYDQEGIIDAHLWAQSAQGCLSDTVNRTEVIQASHAFAGLDTLVALGYPIRLHASGGLTYSWSPPAGLDNADISDPIALITTDTRYTLTAYSSDGCPSHAEVLIKVYSGPAIYVPGAFTPNGDGINDVLQIVAPGIKTLSWFRVFDRWGREVFYSTDLRLSWNGTRSGHPLPTGTYVWTLRATDLNGRVLSQKGTVFLAR